MPALWPHLPGRIVMRASLAAGALILAALAGATAQHWNPYTRQLDRTADVPTLCMARPAHGPMIQGRGIMSEEYNGWTNRETWAVALWINNEQGSQESVHDLVRELVEQHQREQDDRAEVGRRYDLISPTFVGE